MKLRPQTGQGNVTPTLRHGGAALPASSGPLHSGLSQGGQEEKEPLISASASASGLRPESVPWQALLASGTAVVLLAAAAAFLRAKHSGEGG